MLTDLLAQPRYKLLGTHRGGSHSNLDHSSIINIWLLSYSVSNYRDVVKGHEVAGGIKSETQVIDVWTAELTVITQRAKSEILPGRATGGTV